MLHETVARLLGTGETSKVHKFFLRFGLEKDLEKSTFELVSGPLQIIQLSSRDVLIDSLLVTNTAFITPRNDRHYFSRGRCACLGVRKISAFDLFTVC